MSRLRAERIVGIGASAGGLSALKRLFGSLRERETGAAYVVVQHLDPNHPTSTPSILQKVSGCKVDEASVGVDIEPNRVYTAPPGSYLAIEHGRFALHETPLTRHTRRPIDFFMRTLADDRGASAVGIVLSGTGTDGSQGVRDIKSAGGAVLVQDPQDAEFDGMPRSAIDTGIVDGVADVEVLAERLHRILRAPAGAAPPAGGLEADGIDQVLEVLRRDMGYDFRDYKRGTLDRRVRRRMGLHGVTDFDVYLDRLEGDEQERRTLVSDLLIGVTRFFRDAEAWDEFERHAVAPTVERLADGDPLRAWVAGCATGEEAYTLAICILDSIAASGKDLRLQVFASDLNPQALETARAGRYPASSVADLPPERVARWFTSDGEGGVRVRAELRERVVFAAQNLVSDPPFSVLDLISCRNLLIYLDTAAKTRLMEIFHFALKESGYLILGVSEGIEQARTLFAPATPRARIFRRLPGRTPTPARLMRAPSSEAGPRQSEGSETGVDVVVRAMLSRFAPPAVLVSEEFEILRVHGEIGRFLEFRRGDLTSSFLAMVKEAYQTEVWSVLHAARRLGGEAELTVAAPEPDGTPVRILAEPVAVAGRNAFLVYFLPDTADTTPTAFAGEVAAEPGAVSLLQNYLGEITALREELRRVVESSDSSNEELQAANEEVMSTNEELQSSNEELETSREELQSLNEELTSINAELEDKVAELEAANDDLSNLFSSTDIATVFLDTDLCIRRFTSRTTDLFRIRDADVGRPLEDITRKIDDPGLIGDIRNALERLERVEVEVRGEPGVFLRRVTPYRTRADQVQGVIITYSDVTRLRRAAESLVLQSGRQQSIVRLGELALGSEDVGGLFARAVAELKDCLGADIIGIFEHDDDAFALAAGTGWARGLVGKTRIPDSMQNELGFALRRSGAAVFDDIDRDGRIVVSDVLRDAGVVGGVSITIGPLVEPWGVLTAWWRKAGTPDEAAVNYAASVASILWLAIAQGETKRLRESRQQELQGLIDGLPVLIGAIGKGLRFELCNNAFEALGWMPDELNGVHVADVFGQEAASAVETLLSAAPHASGGAEIDIQFPGEGARTHLLYCVPRGKPPYGEGFFLAALDISDRKRWEERNRVISAELDHRVKNILALVNTIARMTGRNAQTIEGFREVFGQRIDSLARTHAKLATRNWVGSNLRELIEEEVAAYATQSAERCTLDGPDVALSTEATQSFALALHELTTNAAKHGALSRNTGRLEVRWSVDGDSLHIAWSEHGIAGLTEPTRQGFGSTVVQNAVIRQLEGELDRSFSDEGIVYRITIPLDNIA